ncbi:MAG: polyprenyl synthetase family protein [Anaerolineales bacterium]|nr:polyprenyl synthetase family protein [Anaerolineales bacterium]
MTADAQSKLLSEMREAIEKDLMRSMQSISSSSYVEMHQMVEHHMGWSDPAHTRGKRVRPLLALLSCSSVDKSWQQAIPAATAVELLHNFSLIHDDIEDRSEKRRGRPTVWKQWGIAQAVNTGDALFTLAHLSMFRLPSAGITSETLINVLQTFDEACLRLTQGQYLDLAFESQSQIPTAEYLEMIEGKTAALIAASTVIGAKLGGAQPEKAKLYYDFGYHMGNAFQILDDVLGIWGHPDITGKSQGDDLRARKKTLPVVYTMERSTEFVGEWSRAGNEEKDIQRLIHLLESVEAEAYARSVAEEQTEHALSALEEANPTGVAGQALRDLVHRLLQRDR